MSKPKVKKLINAAKEKQIKKITHYIQGKLNNGLFLIRNNEGQKEIE